MRHSKYSLPAFWKHKINQNETFWGGLFENQPIKRSSLIINPVILNPYSDQSEDAWAVYPNPQSIIGYLKYLYLPTAFIGMIEEEMENRYYFVENLLELLDEMKEENIDKMALIDRMESVYIELDMLWNENDKECLEQLIDWSCQFNEEWQENGIILSINLFRSPKETMNFIIQSYERIVGIDQLESDLGFTKDELLEIASDNIFHNDFMKRKFADLLTDRLAITV